MFGLYQVEATHDSDVTLETQLLDLISNVGADADGGFTADGTTIYIPAATSIRSETKLLDAAIKQVSDNLTAAISGMTWKDPVRVATVDPLAAGYAAGVLTASANADINTAGIDGITDLAVGEEILVQDQVNAAHNGIYVIDDLGSAGTPFVLTRRADSDEDSEISQTTIFAQEGTTNADGQFTLTTDGAIVIGTTDLAFIRTNGLGQIEAGNGLTKVGTTLAVGAGFGIEVSADAVTVKLDGATLQKDVNGVSVQYQNGIATTLSDDGSGLKVDVDIDSDLAGGTSAAHDTVPSALAAKTYTDTRDDLLHRQIFGNKSTPLGGPVFFLRKDYTLLSGDVSGTNPVVVTVPDSAVYEPNKGNIMVFVNGQLRDAASYTESSQSTVTLTNTGKDKVKSGAVITFLIGKPANTAYSLTVAHDGSNRVATLTYSGDVDMVINYTYNTDDTVATMTKVQGGVTTTETFSYTAGLLTGVVSALT